MQPSFAASSAPSRIGTAAIFMCSRTSLSTDISRAWHLVFPDGAESVGRLADMHQIDASRNLHAILIVRVLQRPRSLTFTLEKREPFVDQ
jgi:hypothetical protein